MAYTEITKNKVLKLALFTLFGFSGIGLLIIAVFSNQSFMAMLQGNVPWPKQILWGTGYGIITALMALFLINAPFLKGVKKFFGELIQSFRLNWYETIFVALCAGVGEEILFRGAIQPGLGIWLTSILFVAVHGYLNPFNLEISLYGVIMVLIIAGVGLLSKMVGLVSAMAAHTVIDIILLFAITHSTLPEVPEEEQPTEEE